MEQSLQVMDITADLIPATRVLGLFLKGAYVRMLGCMVTLVDDLYST